MSFPVLQSATPISDAVSLGPTIQCPAVVNAGDLLLAVSIVSDREDDALPPAGWTVITVGRFGNAFTFIVSSKKAIGNEGGTAPHGSAAGFGFWSTVCLRITGWSGTLADIKYIDTFSGGSATVDPSPISAAASGDNMFGIVLFTDGAWSSWPVGYVDVGAAAGGHGKSVYMATKNAHAISDDPGVINLTAPANNIASTMVIPGLAASAVQRRTDVRPGARVGSRQLVA